MNWNELFLNTGITSTIVIGILIFLGFIVKNSIVSSFKLTIEEGKAELNKQLEVYKNHLDIFKQVTMRYSDKQFEFYSKLWTSLYNLKRSGDDLWEEASPRRLEKFSKQLVATKTEIEKASLFIEDKHYEELFGILSHFLEYQVGKQKLISYREGCGNDDNNVVQLLIDYNHVEKCRYEDLIEKIRIDLKRQLKGNGVQKQIKQTTKNNIA